MTNIWDDLSHNYNLTDARIVGILDRGGGAVVKTMPVLEIAEGRVPTLSSTKIDDHLAKLEYFLSFDEPCEGAPEAMVSYFAKIVITGTHPNGKRLEMRGRGWLGYDENSRIEGRFDKPPTFLVDPDDAYPEEEESTENEFDEDHFLAIPDPKPSPEFAQALYGMKPYRSDD